MRVPADHPDVLRMLADGSAVDTTPSGKHPTAGPEVRKAKKKPELVAPDWEYVGLSGNKIAFTLPILTMSETNERGWHGKSRRTQQARRIVSKAFGKLMREVSPYAEHYHEGNPLRVTMTRIGGHKLDPGVNLPASMKGVEDAVALALGADDGAENWLPVFTQEPGPGKQGVRITLEAI